MERPIGSSGFEPGVNEATRRALLDLDRRIRGSEGISNDGAEGPPGQQGPQGVPGKDGANGKDGQPGTNGSSGANGKDGKDGQDGVTWHVGSGAPASTLGEPGDYYLDGTDGWVYVKRTASSWTNLYINLTGPPGDSSSHSHSYLPLSGGTVSGNTTFTSDNFIIQKKGNGSLSGSLWMEDNWIRIKENNGVYFEKHGGGVYMTDSTWVKTFGNKGLMAHGGMASNGIVQQSSLNGNQYLVWNTNLGSFGRLASTRAIKERIAPMSASVDAGAIIDALNPVTFIAKHAGDEVETAEAKAGREADLIYGFIAEEVCDIDSKLGARIGTYEPNDTDGACDKPSSWGLHPMMAVLVAAVKSQRETIADLTARIEELES